MRAAANFAWCNRQLLTQQAREVFAEVFGKTVAGTADEPGLRRRHNIAKFEEHTVGGGRRSKFASTARERRAPFRRAIPRFRRCIAGSASRSSFPAAWARRAGCWSGKPGSMEQSFGTTCHGAGRMMSRTAAVKLAAGRRIDKELDKIGIIARARGHKGLAEEQPAAYKDVDHVVDVVHRAGSRRRWPGCGRSASSRVDITTTSAPCSSSHDFISSISMTFSPLTGELLLGTITRTPVSMVSTPRGQHFIDCLLVFLDVGLEQPHAEITHLVGVLANGHVDLASARSWTASSSMSKATTVSFFRRSGNLATFLGDPCALYDQSPRKTPARGTC